MKAIEGIIGRLYALFVIIKLIKRDKFTTYVYMRPHIGDVCYALSYISEWKVQNAIKNVTLLTTVKNADICRLFLESCDNVLFCNEKTLKKLMKLRFVIKDLKKLHIPIENHFIDTSPFLFDDRTYHSEDVTAGLITKRVIYNLKGDVKPVFPKIPKVVSEQFVDFCNASKTAIISPYANTVNEISNEFWKSISKHLLDLGYIVYTNAPGEKLEIDGTKKLDCSVVEMLAYANNTDLFIALRSGVLDLIAGCDCKKIVLYNNYEFAELYDMTAWENNDHLYQLYGEPSIDKVMDIVEGKSKDVV